MANRPEISIIVLTKNAEGNIHRTLSLILNQKISRNYEVIAIDSGSADRTVEIIKVFKSVRLIQRSPETFSHGGTRNFGGEMARASIYLVFFNGDAIPKDRNWLAPLIVDLESNKAAAGVFSRHIAKEGCHLYMALELSGGMLPVKSIASLKFLLPQERQAQMRRLMRFSTVSCAVRKSLWNRNRFREDINMAEDQGWSKSMLELGCSIIYEPASVIYHSHNYGVTEFFRYNYNSEKSFNEILGRKKSVPYLFLRLAAQLFYSATESIAMIRMPAAKGLSVFALSKEVIIGLGSRYAAILGEIAANI